MKIAVNPTRATQLCGQAARSLGRVRAPAAKYTQCFSYYHSTATVDAGPGRDHSSLRDADLNPQHWGYRVVLPTKNRTYATSMMSQDYDEHELYNAPTVNTQCDLGAVLLRSPSDVALFDDEDLPEDCSLETDGYMYRYDATTGEEWSIGSQYEHDVVYCGKEVQPAVSSGDTLMEENR